MRRLTIIIALVFSFHFCFSQWTTKDADQFQMELDEWYADEESSPLKGKELGEFSGLEYFSVNSKFKVKAVFQRIENAEEFKMATSSPRNAVYKKYGSLTFRLNGKQRILYIYESMAEEKDPEFADYLILPFTDKTNGKQTYGAGRYLGFWKADLIDDAEVVLDFNLNYNPLCAYNYNYSCIIPPEENHVNAKIKAGVKKWHN